jgi:hypothetical protein
MTFFPGFRLALVDIDSPAGDYEIFRFKLHVMRVTKNTCKRSAKRRKLLKRLRP